MGCSNSNVKEKSSDKQNSKVNQIQKQKQQDTNLKKKRMGSNSKTLSNYSVSIVNESALSVKKYYKNQTPPANTTEQWKDPLFPHNLNSILALKEDGTPVDSIEERYNESKKDYFITEDEVSWLRAKDIFNGGKFVLFENTISVDDVKQGSLGNCYLMSALSSLAETPQLVLQLFRDLTVKDNGCYEIIMRINGEWQIVLVDDTFPCDFEKIPMFAKPTGAELWVMLLEKAWAKVNGGYVNCIAGFPSDVLSTLTTFPNKYYTHSEELSKGGGKDEFWQLILKSAKNDDICTASSIGNNDKEENNGIVLGHAFSLFNAAEGVINGELVRLVKLRNPWGNTEWKGVWSDGSLKWTDEAKKVFGEQENKDDGCFWMDFDDYLNYFDCTEICMFMNPQITKSVTIPEESASLGNVVEFTVYNNCEVSIGGIGPHWRFTREIGKMSYLQMNKILLKKENVNFDIKKPDLSFTYISSEQASDIKVEVTPGTYLIYVKANFDIEETGFNKTYPFMIQIGASDYFDIAYKGADTENDIGRIAMIKCIENIRESEIIPDEVNTLQEDTCYPLSLGYYYVINNSSKDRCFSLISDDKYGMTQYCPSSLTESDKIKVSPGEKFIIIASRTKYYDYPTYYFTTIDEETGNEDFCKYKDVEKWMENSKYSDSKANEFVFKRLDIDVSKFCVEIDPAEEAVAFYKNMYPDLMRELLALPKMNDGVKVKFSDKFVFDNGDYVFGETLLEESWNSHGRTIFQEIDGTKFIGYHKNGSPDGEGTTYRPDGEVEKAMYKNGAQVI